jgi:hypothetical protein
LARQVAKAVVVSPQEQVKGWQDSEFLSKTLNVSSTANIPATYTNAAAFTASVR